MTVVRPPMLGPGLSPQAAGWLLRIAMRSAHGQVRRNGVTLPEWVEPVLVELAERADVMAPEMSAGGHAVATVGSSPWTGFVPIAEAAALVDRSRRHVSRLANAGRVRSRRVGKGPYEVDVDSLRSVLRRAS